MKLPDKLRMLAICMWFSGGVITFHENPVVASMTMLSGILFGTALLMEVK